MSEKEEKLELDQALMAAQKSMTGIAKGSRNDFGKYSYVSAEDVVKDCRVVLHEHGLVFYPLIQRIEGIGDDLVINQTYMLTHVKSGEYRHIDRTMILPMSEKGKSLCQSQGGAETYMLKNTLRELLLVPRFDAKEEIDGGDYREATNSRRRR